MLRKIRTITAIVFFSLLTLLFLDFTGTIHHSLGWLAKTQLLPAILALNIVAIVVVLAITLLLGRIYCSVICPLGVFQDIVSWIAGIRNKRRFTYSPPLSLLRYITLSVFVLAIIAGIASVVSLLEPYSAYGRMASAFFVPVYQWGNNLLAYFAERADSYLFYSVDVWHKSIMVTATAGVTLVAVAVLAWRHGRTYCNAICPVGTALGLLAKYAWLKPAFDTDKCNQCGLCARNCKAACIDTKAHQIDYSRCITCFDCVDVCRQDAIKYKPVNKQSPSASVRHDQTNPSRRNFLSITTLLAVSTVLKSQEKLVDGGLAIIEDKKVPPRLAPISPPGSQSSRNMMHHCTACQLCVSACPNQVLHPSGKFETLMQPQMSYERGYCRPECVRCSEVCPTGAIHTITPADKSAIQIGHAVWVKQNCVVITDEVRCGNCAHHCPVGAIQMVPLNAQSIDSLTIPAVNTERCIGCGACEHLCPSRPFSAIYVEGHEMHRTV